jgi:hypothetical protein
LIESLSREVSNPSVILGIIKYFNLNLDFHTIDTDHESLGLDSKEKENMTGIEKRKMNVRRKLERDQRKERIFSQKLTTSKLLEVDSDYLEMRKPFKQVSIYHVI